MFDDLFESKVLDERGKRRLQLALEALEECMPKVKQPREIEQFDPIVQLSKKPSKPDSCQMNSSTRYTSA